MDSEGDFQKFLEEPTYPSHNYEQILFKNLEEILLKFRGFRGNPFGIHRESLQGFGEGEAFL